MRCAIGCRKWMSKRTLARYLSKERELSGLFKKYKINDTKLEGEIRHMVFDCVHWFIIPYNGFNPFDNKLKVLWKKTFKFLWHFPNI